MLADGFHAASVQDDHRGAMKASEMSFFTMASSKLGCLQT
jgi:hypothetical protein